jgi:hypothetical protein
VNFIRIFWGDFNRYSSQIIETRNENMDETVFVWGTENLHRLEELGYRCVLLGEEPYDEKIAKDHTYLDHRSLIHKIKGLEIALQHFSEIVFLDWDVVKIKEPDQNFWDTLRRGASLQVPLYAYPPAAFDFLRKAMSHEVMQHFFNELEGFIKKYSFEYDGDFVIPNTGFIYCNDKNVPTELLSLIEEYGLATVPDELSVFLFTKDLGLEGYIKKHEPSVMGKKEHSHEWWDSREDGLEKLKTEFIHKDHYFRHL